MDGEFSLDPVKLNRPSLLLVFNGLCKDFGKGQHDREMRIDDPKECPCRFRTVMPLYLEIVKVQSESSSLLILLWVAIA